MARRMPNLTALLGLLAIAGYKNRDKISDLLTKAQESVAAKTSGAAQNPADDTLTELNTSFGQGNAGGTVAGGLGELIERFKQNNQSRTADSWVGSGANEPVQTQSLEQALGADTLNELTAKTGMSKDEILSRLSNDLPNAVNDFTPQGRLPRADEIN